MQKKLGLGLVFMLMSGVAWAEIIKGSPESGNGCGANCSWTFDTDTGVLDITGSGEMDNWSVHSNAKGTDSWKAQPWYDYRKQITDITIGQNITSIGNWAFAETSVKTFDIPSNITKLGNAVFHSSALESIDVPDTVTSMGSAVFDITKNLTHVTLPSHTETLGSWFFAATSSLKELILPEKLKTISGDSLTLTALETLVVPASVKTISKEAFHGNGDGESYYAKNLKQLYCTSEQMTQCEAALIQNKSDFKPTRYEKSGNDYLVYDDKGNVVGKYASAMNLNKGTASETYKYDPAGHLVGIFDGNGQRTWGKKIYTVEEAMEVTKDGDRFHVRLTYK